MRHKIKTDKCWKVNSARQGFPGGSDSKESASLSGDLGSIPEDSLEKGMAAHSSFFPGESHGQRDSCLAGCRPRGPTELDTTKRPPR